ncbi:MAG: universal stress protein [Thermodesulfobacteriota bacterium]|nr:universal stress protein [Thermodesulfobacteriota bacterium]
MNNSILVAINDSISSRAVMDYIAGLSLSPDNLKITLLHVYRELSSSEELMGKKFLGKMPTRLLNVLQNAKDKLIENGFNPDKIEIKLVSASYPTVADGIIDQFKKGEYNMVVIGRKRMSKAEEFVLGDISVKLVRAIEGAAVLVVKSV